MVGVTKIGEGCEFLGFFANGDGFPHGLIGTLCGRRSMVRWPGGNVSQSREALPFRLDDAAYDLVRVYRLGRQRANGPASFSMAKVTVTRSGASAT
jgi:hypothetical protein